MRRIKSAPANIAEMVNRRQPDKPTKNKLVVVPPKNRDNSPKPLFERERKCLIYYTERATNVLNDVINDVTSLSFEETAILGILLNLLNNTFRRDKLRDLSGIIAQQLVKYIIMFYIHHYVINDYIEHETQIVGMLDLIPQVTL